MSKWKEEGSDVLLLIGLFGVIFIIPFSFLPTIDAQLLRYLLVTTVTILMLGRTGIKFNVLSNSGKQWLAGIGIISAGCIFAIWSLVDVRGIPFQYLAPVPSLALFIVLGVALNEEVFARGAIQTILTRITRPRWAIIGSASVFAALHVPAYVALVAALPFAIGYLFGLGLLLGFLYWRTRNLLLSIAVHAFADLFGYGTVINQFSLPATDAQSMIPFLGLLALPILVVALRNHIPAKPIGSNKT